MEFRTKKQRKKGQVDMAPLVDIVFLLLVFFIVGAHFTKPVIQIELPLAGTHDTAKQQEIRLVVKSSRQIYVNGKEVLLHDLDRVLQVHFKQTMTREVVFSGDRSLDYDLFVQVLDLAHQAGATSFSIEHRAVRKEYEL